MSFAYVQMLGGVKIYGVTDAVLVNNNNRNNT